MKDIKLSISVMAHPSREQYFTYLSENLGSVLHLPGDVVELGCNVGGTSLFIQRLIKRSETDKTFHVYDSFEGLPPKAPQDGATPCDKGASAVSMKRFYETFLEARVDSPIVNKGFFGGIKDEFYPEKICFAFFDGDFYDSIIDSFKKVYHKMSPGGIILVHDYEYEPFPGVKKACDDFLADKPERMIVDIKHVGKMVKQ